MTGDEPRWIELPRPVLWSYATLPHTGACRIDGRPLRLTLALASQGRTRRVPDVLSVEAWLSAHLERPTTAEEAALAASLAFPRMRATVTATSTHHGEITAEAGGH